MLLFASYADALGARAIDVPLALPCTVREMVAVLRMMPGGALIPVGPLVAVNQALVTADESITAGDEVAVIPPVAGG